MLKNPPECPVKAGPETDRSRITWQSTKSSPNINRSHWRDMNRPRSGRGRQRVTAKKFGERDAEVVDDVLLNTAGAGLVALASRRWWRATARASSDQPRSVPVPGR
jgi:hypothetical protein